MSPTFRIAVAALWLATVLSAQTQDSGPASEEKVDPLPKPGCDSYSMQTLPKDAFRMTQRACFWRSQLFTTNAVFGASLFGVISEARHKPPEWPQGLDGFGRQMGTRYTQGMVKTTATFLVSAITREDPRPKPPPYLSQYSKRFGCRPATTVKARLGQSLLRVVWDACEEDPIRRLSPGRLAGSFASGFVSLAWAPPSQHKVSTALVGSGTAFGGYIADSVMKEFESDLFGWVGKMFTTGKPHMDKLPKRPGSSPAEGGPK